MENKVYPAYPVLIVDDEQNFLNSLDFELQSAGLNNVECCVDSREVLGKLRSKKYSVVLLDLLMPHITGDELLPQIVEEFPELPVIVVTAFIDNETIIHCLKNGAFDCHTKPINTRELIRTIQDTLDLKDVYQKIIPLKKELYSKPPHNMNYFPNFITDSPVMQSVYQHIGLIAFTSKPVLIEGEAGTGKEFLAQEIHKLSFRKGKYIPIDITGMDDQLFNLVLFGCKKNAWPGIKNDMTGLIQEADGGTLFVNEISILSLESQSKLLRILQDREYFPIGDNTPRPVNVRLVVAAEKKIDTLVKVGSFHSAFYECLKPNVIHLIPLRERRGDIQLLIHHFLEEAAFKNGIVSYNFPEELYSILDRYNFPGNIGEIKRMAQAVMSREQTGAFPLDVFLMKAQKRIEETLEAPDESIYPSEEKPSPYRIIFRGALPKLEELESAYWEEINKRSGGQHGRAAKMAGISKKRIHHIRYWSKINAKKEKEK